MSRPAAKDRIRDARQAMYRDHILDAAEEVFAEHGYEAAKVQMVASQAGVSLATLYGVFETKWDLYRAVHARRTSALVEYVQTRGETQGDLLDRMLAGISAYVEFHMEHRNYLRMHLREGHVWSTSSTLTSPEQVAAWEAGLTRMSRAFQLGIDAGLYVGEDRPELLARTNLALSQVRLADWVDRGMKESVEEVTASIHRQFIRAFCRASVVLARLGKDA
jgi:AcrR family transcriptional regulator